MTRTYSEFVAPNLPIRASHVATLRSYINADASNVPPAFRYTFSWTTVASGQAVLAKHLTEMRSAIQLLWDSKGRGPLPDWSSGVVPGGPSNSRTPSAILASDITDLRRWLNDYEDNHSKSGVNSYSYSPNSPNNPRIALSWAQNVAALSTTFPPPIRCNIVASSSNLSNVSPLAGDISAYGAAFQTYQSANLSDLYAVLGMEFLNQGGGSSAPNFSFTEGTFYNSYIQNFASKVSQLATQLSSTYGVKKFIIWNEANDISKPEKFLDSEHFASLLYHSHAAIKALVSDAVVVWGGVIFGPGGANNTPDENSLNFMRGVYSSLIAQDLAGVDGKPWPWDAVNIHIHQIQWMPVGPNRTQQSIENIFSSVRQVMLNEGLGDGSPILVGEYGVTIEEEGDHSGNLNRIFNWIKRCNPDGMFYFSHGRTLDNGTWALVLETYESSGTRIVVDSEFSTYGFFKTLLETLP